VFSSNLPFQGGLSGHYILQVQIEADILDYTFTGDPVNAVSRLVERCATRSYIFPRIFAIERPHSLQMQHRFAIQMWVKSLNEKMSCTKCDVVLVRSFLRCAVSKMMETNAGSQVHVFDSFRFSESWLFLSPLSFQHLTHSICVVTSK
jgi:hypothetical protein